MGLPIALDYLSRVDFSETDRFERVLAMESRRLRKVGCVVVIAARLNIPMVDIMIRSLAKIRPKYGLIFRELFSGNTCPSQIAKALGLKKSQIYADVEKVRKLAAKIYFDLLEK